MENERYNTGTNVLIDMKGSKNNECRNTRLTVELA